MLSASPRQRQSAERRAALAQAALVLAARCSPGEVTTVALAQSVGITQGAVFRHFASKEAVWIAAIESAHQALLGRLQRAAAAHPQPMEALRAVFLAHVDFVLECPGLPRVVFHELQQPHETPLKQKVRHLMDDYRQLLLDLLRQSQTPRGGLDDHHLQPAAALFMGSIQGLVIQSLLGMPDDLVRQQSLRVWELYQRALSDPAHTSTHTFPESRSSK